MKIKKGLVLKEVAGNYIVVPTGGLVKEFNGVANLNSTSAFLWENCIDTVDKEKLVSLLIKEYDVKEEVAVKGVEKFIEMLKKEGFVD